MEQSDSNLRSVQQRVSKPSSLTCRDGRLPNVAREDLQTAVRYYEKALESDHKYALAYAGLAHAYQGLGARRYIAPIDGRHKSEEAARKALMLDENLGEAHTALGHA